MEQAPKATTVRRNFKKRLQRYWQQRYDAYRHDQESPENFLQRCLITREAYQQTPSAFPPSVRAAYDYYLTAVEQQDWGVVRLYRVAVARQPIYAVRVTTDGDDGWLELYDEQGAELGVGRTYLELVGWGAQDAIRAEVANGEFPPALADRATRTLWGK